MFVSVAVTLIDCDWTALSTELGSAERLGLTVSIFVIVIELSVPLFPFGSTGLTCIVSLFSTVIGPVYSVQSPSGSLYSIV